MMTQEKKSTANYNMDPDFIQLMESEVAITKKSKVPIARAFERISQKSGLKLNTVRNYYYRYINDKGMRRYYEQVEVSPSFTKEETKQLICSMLELLGKGFSVRAASSKLAEGDPKRLLRNQNKYRNTLAKNTRLVEEVLIELQHKNRLHMNPYTKALYIPRERRSDEETPLKKLETGLRRLNNPDMNGLIYGLGRLLEIAAESTEEDLIREKLKHRDDRITELEGKLRETETALLMQSQEARRLTGELKRIREISGSFLNLSQAEKITHLPDYIHQLNGYIAKN